LGGKCTLYTSGDSSPLATAAPFPAAPGPLAMAVVSQTCWRTHWAPLFSHLAPKQNTPTQRKKTKQNKTANKSETEKILIIQLLKQNLSATSSQKKRDSEKPL